VSRYAGRDNTPPPVGANKNNNGFNQVTDSSGRNSRGESIPCSHEVLGVDAGGVTKDAAGNLKFQLLCVEILPKDFVCWCSGTGAKGSAANANNNGYFQIEVCENQALGKQYADKCYAAMVERSVEFFKEIGITDPTKISRANLTCHSEGHEDGIASNHGDPFHWLGKYGYSMEGLRIAVKSELSKSASAGANHNAPAISVANEALWRVVIASHKNRGDAEREVADLRKKGFETFIYPTKI
jgi:hypothetical protein